MSSLIYKVTSLSVIHIRYTQRNCIISRKHIFSRNLHTGQCHS